MTQHIENNMSRIDARIPLSVRDTIDRAAAMQGMKRGFTTVVAARESSSPDVIVGIYTRCAASILLTTLPEDTARKMPRYPSVPAVRLGRLAVASSCQG